MPANAPISISDAASTPVSHTFSPIGIDTAGVALFKERVSGVPIGYPTLTVSMRDPVQNSPVYRGVLKLQMPHVVTTTDASGKVVTSVDYTCVANLDFQFPVKSSLQDRKNVVKLIANALGDANIQKVLQDLERFW